MNSTLFDPTDTGALDDDLAVARERRRRVLGGILQVTRARSGWKVNDAASAAGIAPMTWRRMEDGLAVRERSYIAVDGILGVTPGTVKRALNDDLLMVELVGRTGVDVGPQHRERAADFLDHLARGIDGATAKRTVSPETAQALAMAAQHVPAVRPTSLDLTSDLLKQLGRELDPAHVTPAIRELVRAAAQAIPDLMRVELKDCERDIAALQEKVDDLNGTAHREAS